MSDDALRRAAERLVESYDLMNAIVPLIGEPDLLRDVREVAGAYLAEQENRHTIILRLRYILGTCRGEEEMRAEAREVLRLMGVEE